MTDILINSILWLRLSVLYSLIQHTLITYDIASDVEDSAVMMLVETTRWDPGWHMGVGRTRGQRPLSGRMQFDLSRAESKWKINRRESEEIEWASDMTDAGYYFIEVDGFIFSA